MPEYIAAEVQSIAASVAIHYNLSILSYRHRITNSRLINIEKLERRFKMKLINSRKLSWLICGVTAVFTIVALVFLPGIMPMHFTGGIADGFSNKAEICLFPLLQIIIIVLSGIKKVKYCLTHSKMFLNDVQYNWIISGLCIFIFAVEIGVAYVSFY